MVFSGDFIKRLPLAARFAWRELRGGIRGFRIFLICLIMGVAAIASVGSLSNAIEASLARDAQKLLGGDISLRLNLNPASQDQINWLEANSQGLSQIAILRAMASHADFTRSRLVEVKAIDNVYPLYGKIGVATQKAETSFVGLNSSNTTQAPEEIDEIEEIDETDGTGATLLASENLHNFLQPDQNGRYGAVVGAGLMARLDLKIGDIFRLGDQAFEVRGEITNEPDRSTQAFELGPRVIITRTALEETGLLLPGALVRYHYRLKLDAQDDTDIQKWRDDLSLAFPEAGWRLRDRANAAPNIQQFTDRVGMFLTLVGLTALLVGGVGIGNAIRAHIQGRLTAIATLKCLGASSSLVIQTIAFQMGVLALLGIGIGCVLGAVAPILVADLLSARLPITVEIGFHPLPLLLAALFGFLVSVTFAIVPLDQSRKIKPAALFRSGTALFHALPSLRAILWISATVAILLLAALYTARDQWLASGFLLGAGLTLLVFRLTAGGVTWLAAKSSGYGPAIMRMGLANLHRPGATTASIVMSLGLGLTILVAVTLTESNMNRQINAVLAGEAPGFYFIDIQQDQVAPFTQLLAEHKVVNHFESVPMLRGTIESLNNVPVSEIVVPSQYSWVVRGDRGLTWSRTPPTRGSEVVAGEWWPADYDDESKMLVSFDAEAAEAYGLSIGDPITINVMGRIIEAEITNLRKIDWNSLGINFVMIFSPGILSNAPQTHIFTAYLDPNTEALLEQAVVTNFPNVSAIWVKEILAGVAEIIANVGIAIRIIATVAIIAGILVLAGSLAAAQQRHLAESVILKVLGVTRLRILTIFLTEYGLIGIVAGFIALFVGAIASFVVVDTIMQADWQFDPSVALITLSIALGTTLIAGFIGTYSALSAKSADLLRND